MKRNQLVNILLVTAMFPSSKDVVVGLYPFKDTKAVSTDIFKHQLFILGEK
jgi:hypothetical protein